MSQHPEPQSEEPQLSPGGPDSVADPKYGDTPGPPTTRDLPPEDNPAVDDVLPEEIREEDEEKTQDPDRTSGEGPIPEESQD
jgi:hypothetical protein